MRYKLYATFDNRPNLGMLLTKFEGRFSTPDYVEFQYNDEWQLFMTFDWETSVPNVRSIWSTAKSIDVRPADSKH